MSTPFFSVILPTHNGAGHIRKALESVRMQRFTDYELIVVCDACEDGTAEIAREYTDRVLEVDVHRDGLARNAGIDAATGDWLLFIDDDDEFVYDRAFEDIAEIAQHEDSDWIDFDTLWDRQYYAANEREVYAPVWCRAWRRAFFGGLRYNDMTYGSDSALFHRMLRKNPRIRRLNRLVYNYNYMRPGSLSDQLSKGKIQAEEETDMPYIDIIITHYDEPQEVGLRLFASLASQACVKPEAVHIILVQDGKDTALNWDALMRNVPYSWEAVTLPRHAGMAEARNAGIDKARAEWVMFMDFDDALGDIATLCMLTRLFPVDKDLDIIWGTYLREVKDYGRFKDTTLNMEKDHDFRMIGKLFRREFLNEHQIRFVSEFPEHADVIFNTMANAMTYPFKIAQFTTEFFPYFKALRPDGAFSTLESMQRRMRDRFARDVYLVNEMRGRGNEVETRNWIARAIADAYHTIRNAELAPEENCGITEEVIRFWKENRDDFRRMTGTDVEVALDISQTEAMTYVQELYNYYSIETYLQNDTIPFLDFMTRLNDLAERAEPEIPAVIEGEGTVTEPVTEERKARAVVYCGTKETYINMIASVKSLLATTPVDKVYFLIEDDEFPYPLPEIIETRNVKDTGLFDPNGPNYNNAWTYMCLMRTAFPQMFPQYDRILSLDIDVVIAEDISELWEIDLSRDYIAGVGEQGRVPEGSEDVYVNFGVIMMNLDKLRKDGLGDRLIHAVNTEHFGCPEQDAFNKYCKGHIYRLANDYNVTVYSHITGEPLTEKILHYAGLRYWKHFEPVRRFYNLTWDELTEKQVKLHG